MDIFIFNPYFKKVSITEKMKVIKTKQGKLFLEMKAKFLFGSFISRHLFERSLCIFMKKVKGLSNMH